MKADSGRDIKKTIARCPGEDNGPEGGGKSGRIEGEPRGIRVFQAKHRESTFPRKFMGGNIKGKEM